MLNFEFLEKGLGIVSPLHFMYDLSRKMFVKFFPFTSRDIGQYVHCIC